MGHDRRLLRLAGLAALAGAALRVVAAFPSAPVPGLTPEALYLSVDVLLMLGLVGLFAGVPRFRSVLGAVGFVGAVAGFMLVRTGERLGGTDAYQTAAAILAGALTVAGVALASGRGLIRWAGAAWIASFAVGLAGTLLHQEGAFLAASLLFCAGFGMGGVVLLRGGDGRA